MAHPVQPIEEAPKAIQLAVDLIYLLEANEVDPVTALEALQIVRHDLERKITAAAPEKTIKQ
ncbi:hypothetical protein VA7868_01017 [Vibrio aerogenes CECT 7868]|uniref:Primosomal protein n=2 Tax=Vibrio aerogenes TaxID=92172 RepID=A0A1M5X8X6_9VIBR|nr:pleiotropic regulatory protein RsmS [Vibrio aerogenes]SHH95663.1 hypothetical protein VA7868_01017 [Vibrio aerogenes CECT 7868]